MRVLEEKLNRIRKECSDRRIRIMIIGLGSVGGYLLDYLMSAGNENIEIYVVGRNAEKMQKSVNIVRVSSLIRHQNRSNVIIESGVDFNDISAIEGCLRKYCPDIIVNSSRAYSGLKYGSISWANVRAYGIWAPLSIKYAKNIMEAYEKAECNAIVINTSYSDAVIPWIKSAGMAYPDFGSGNINHLIPRIKMAVSQKFGISDYWNIDVTYAVSHFHDVVISKEGHTEGVEQLISIEYNGKVINTDISEIFSMCSIAMPVDAKRNMMNASSNYEIICSVLDAALNHKKRKLHCPGIFGEIGGYPVILDGENNEIKAYIDTSIFSIETMRAKNKESIYLDGIKDVSNGTLYYTDELCEKVKKAFGVELMRQVGFDEIPQASDFLIKEIIEKFSA